jgi:hypothetical protein
MSSRLYVALPISLLSLLPSFAAQADSAFAYRAGTSRLIGFSTNAPQTLTLDIPITGISAGETLVGIDVRPQNGQLYGLGVNAASNTATLYAISTRTGVAGVVGTIGSIAYTDGAAIPVDLPDPSTIGYGIDVNPTVDRVRVVAGALNFRIDPNTGTPIDGNLGGAAGSVAGVNTDGPVNGGTTTVDATAYTNDQPNATVTTQYTLDAASNTLYIQNPPNSGTQTLGLALTSGGTPLDFASNSGFDIPAFVNVAASNMPASGSAFAALSVGGVQRLHRIDLVNGQTFALGTIGDGSVPNHGLALRQGLPGIPMIGLTQGGVNLVRFNSSSIGTSTSVTVTGVAAGETLVGIDFRPQTGQLFGLGVNAVANNATLYRIDPQGAAGTTPAVAIGTPGQIAFVDASGATPVDLPDPVTADYGFDFNPTVDRIRITTSTGLNFRANPNTGAAVDGDIGTGSPVAGTNTDGPISGLPVGSTGVGGAAYTNSFGQSLSGGVTTLYTLDAASNALFIQNPANAGTQTTQRDVLLNGVPLDFADGGGFDIAPDVAVTVSAAPAVGIGYAALSVGGSMGLYSIDLGDGSARLLGPIATPLRGLTLADVPATDMFRNGFE